MKKIAAAAALALGLTLSSPAAAIADPICVDQILDPIIQIPIQVCIDQPIIDTPIQVPSVPVPPVVPPVTTPELPASPSDNDDAPTAPAPTSDPQPTPSATPGPTPEEKFLGELAERAFPLMLLLFLLAVMFGGSKAYELLRAQRAKRLDKEESAA